MQLAIITSAPAHRPRYLSELLEVVALPQGMTGQFTYRKKWFSHGAWAMLTSTTTATGIESATLVYAEAGPGGTRAYPLRTVNNVRLVTPVPATTDDDTLYRVAFDVGPLYPYPAVAEREVALWSAEIGQHLRSELDEAGSGVIGSVGE